MSSVNVLADVFTSEECQKILKNKYVLLIGDSVIRGMYKDLVKFLQKDEHLCDYQLKNKGEFKFENDALLEGGRLNTLNNDVTYTEMREYKAPFNLVRFYFVTRCYSDYLKSICDDVRNDSEKPDLVIMNSGCWDLTRYGLNSIYEYKKNLPLGIYELIKVLPCNTLFLWTTTLPLSKDVKGGFMVPEAECRSSKLREDVLEANKFAVNVIDEFRLDLLDLHFYFRNQIQRRAKDGIHWDATAHRRITNLILHHMCDAWELETPGRVIMKDEILKTKKAVENMESNDFENYTNYTNFESDQPRNVAPLPRQQIIEMPKNRRLFPNISKINKPKNTNQFSSVFSNPSANRPQNCMANDFINNPLENSNLNYVYNGFQANSNKMLNNFSANNINYGGVIGTGNFNGNFNQINFGYRNMNYGESNFETDLYQINDDLLSNLASQIRNFGGNITEGSSAYGEGFGNMNNGNNGAYQKQGKKRKFE